MTRYFLSRMAIEGFRGINNSGDPLILSFKPTCVNSVYASNGIGKTSIFEALQFAIFGKIPRLESLQDAEQGDRYVVNCFHPGQMASIEITLSPDDGGADVTILVTRGAGGARTVTSPSGHPTPADLLHSLREDFVLVDYKAFSSFIDNSALLRGRSFSALIGLSQYSNLRQAIEGANNTATLRSDFDIKALKASIDAYKVNSLEAQRKAIEAYSELTGQKIQDLDDRTTIMSTVTKILTDIDAVRATMEGKNAADFDYKSASAALENDADAANRFNLQKMRQDREVVRELSFSDEHIAQLSALEKAASERDEALLKIGHAELLSLLRSASRLIGTPAWPQEDLCPVCDAQQGEPLRSRLDEKIAAYDAVREKDEEIARLCQECSAVALLGKLEGAAALAVPADEQICSNLLRAAREGSVSTSEIGKIRLRIETLTKARDDRVSALEKEILDLESRLPPSIAAAARAIENARKFRDECATYDDYSAKLDAAIASQAKIDRWISFIGKAEKAFARAETDLSNARLNDIEISYKRLFPLLMRGAPDLKPHLARADKSENIDLTLTDFYGEKNVNARAVLSESYRNAVAASIFLSAAMQHSRPPRFMVLDDITSSFDGGHQFNLMNVLLSELQFGAKADGIQIVLLSHDSALEKFFDRLGNTKEWHHQKLQGMPPTGAVQSTSQGADRLKQQATALLGQGSVDLAGPLVRQYLEYKLSYIIGKLQILVPPDYATKSDNRTLSTYIDSITRAVELYDKANECVLDSVQKTAVKQTHATSIIANCISHYETSAGQPFTAHMLLGVIQDIDAYAENFQWVDPQNPGQRIFYRRLDKK